MLTMDALGTGITLVPARVHHRPGPACTSESILVAVAMTSPALRAGRTGSAACSQCPRPGARRPRAERARLLNGSSQAGQGQGSSKSCIQSFVVTQSDIGYAVMIASIAVT